MNSSRNFVTAFRLIGKWNNERFSQLAAVYTQAQQGASE